MEGAKTAQEIGHDAEKGEEFVEPRVRPFEHDFVGSLGRRGGSRVSIGRRDICDQVGRHHG
jgi:hypothetical protein